MHSQSHAQGGPALPHSQKGRLPALLPRGSEAHVLSKTQGHVLGKVRVLALLHRTQAWCQKTLALIPTQLLTAV